MKSFAQKTKARSFSFALFGIGLLVAVFMLDHETADHRRFLNGWMEAVQSMGWRSLAGDFANYTPPYIYLMATVGDVSRWLGVPAALKLVNLPFLFACAYAAYRTVFLATADQDRAWMAGGTLFVLPSQMVNSFFWGQCDIIYTSLLLMCVASALMRRPWLAAAFLGAALAFKLQAIFLAPFILYLILTRRLQVRHLLLVPAAYIVLMVPAWLAGRPWADLLLVYAGQADFYRSLSMNAPNPWFAAERLGALPYRESVMAGLAVTSAAVLAIGVSAVRRVRSSQDMLLLATFSAAVVPFLLPKMHDRYFFPADVLLLVLAFVRPRLAWLAVLGQIGSLGAYGGYFGVERYMPGGFEIQWIGLIAYAVVVSALLIEFLRLPTEKEPVAGLETSRR